MFLLTHPAPHLDDLAGIWLLQRFVPRYKSARVRFTPANKVRLGRTDVAVGIGRGRFDEHKGDVGESAASLVWKYARAFVREPARRAALDELVEFVRKGDTGELYGLPYPDFGIHAAVATLPFSPTQRTAIPSPRRGRGPRVRGMQSRTMSPDNNRVTRFTFEYLGALYQGLYEKQLFKNEWRRAKFFRTRWGRGVAMETAVLGGNKLLAEAAKNAGCVLYIYILRHKGYRAIKAFPPRLIGGKKIDLSAAYARVHSLEPNADWFLHHTKQMLICGSDVTENRHLSRMTLRQLIDLVQQ